MLYFYNMRNILIGILLFVLQAGFAQTATQLDSVYTIVEEMPRFPGCEEMENVAKRRQCADKKMLETLYGNLKIPSVSRGAGGGTYIVSFIVEKDGTISNFKTRLDPLGVQDQLEVILKEAGPWIPGKNDGNHVRVQMHLKSCIKLEY